MSYENRLSVLRLESDKNIEMKLCYHRELNAKNNFYYVRLWQYIPDCMLLQAYNQQPYPYEQQRNVDEQVHIVLAQLSYHIFEIPLAAMLLS